MDIFVSWYLWGELGLVLGVGTKIYVCSNHLVKWHSTVGPLYLWVPPLWIQQTMCANCICKWGISMLGCRLQTASLEIKQNKKIMKKWWNQWIRHLNKVKELIDWMRVLKQRRLELWRLCLEKCKKVKYIFSSG